MKRRIIRLLVITITVLVITSIVTISTPRSSFDTVDGIPSTFRNNLRSVDCNPPQTSGTWTKYSNPVMDIGPEGSWDSAGVYFPTVMLDGSSYRMWFTGTEFPGLGDARPSIGYATSPDGIRWTKHANNPVLRRSQSGWDSEYVKAPHVIFHGGLYKMWYVGSFLPPAVRRETIGYATSLDGIQWVKNAVNPVFQGGPGESWDRGPFQGLSVLVEGNTYKMWYSAGRDRFGIGYATSVNGVDWVRQNNGNPVLELGATGTWDSLFISNPNVLFNGQFYEMWYSGVGDLPSASGSSSGSGIGHATSTDGIHWTKDTDNPIIVSGLSNSWDSGSVGKPSVILEGRTYKMWYQGSDDCYNLRIGYATSTRTLSDRSDEVAGHQVHVMYVVPSDGTDRHLDLNGVLNMSVDAFQNWLEGETGGPSLRFDTFEGELDITFHRLGRTNQDIANHGERVRDEIEADLRAAGFNHPNKLYAVYYDGLSNTACGGGAWPPSLPGHVAALYLQGLPNSNRPCNQNQFATSEDSPGYLEFAMIHEILHTLGAVATCAPNHILSGHVSGNNTDLMWASLTLTPSASLTPTPWAPSVLDINDDDYYGHNEANCLDLADSVFMDPLPAVAVTPPGWP